MSFSTENKNNQNIGFFSGQQTADFVDVYFSFLKKHGITNGFIADGPFNGRDEKGGEASGRQALLDAGHEFWCVAIYGGNAGILDANE